MRPISLILILVFSIGAMVFAQEGELKLTWNPVRNTISGNVEVVGSANIADQFYFFLEAAPWDPDDAAPTWQPVTSFVMAPVIDGALGSWNTGRFPDGFYQLRLHALNSASESFHYVLAPILINNHNSDPRQPRASRARRPAGRGTRARALAGESFAAARRRAYQAL